MYLCQENQESTSTDCLTDWYNMKDIIERVKMFFYRIYKRAYGMDDLNKALIYTFFGLSVLGLFIFKKFFTLLSNILFLVFLFRYFSSKKFARGEENRAYRKYAKFVKTSFELRKTHKVMLCKCGQMIRVPLGQGKIEVTCPCCGRKFDTKS